MGFRDLPRALRRHLLDLRAKVLDLVRVISSDLPSKRLFDFVSRCPGIDTEHVVVCLHGHRVRPPCCDHEDRSARRRESCRAAGAGGGVASPVRPTGAPPSSVNCGGPSRWSSTRSTIFSPYTVRSVDTRRSTSWLSSTCTRSRASPVPAAVLQQGEGEITITTATTFATPRRSDDEDRRPPGLKIFDVRVGRQSFSKWRYST